MQGWKVGSLAAAAIALFVGWYVGSPWLTLYNIKSAVERHDVEGMIGYVDFDALRLNLKDQVHAVAAAQRVPPTDSSGWSTPNPVPQQLAALDQQIDAYVTAETARALFAKSEAPRPGADTAPGELAQDVTIDRETLGRFVARRKNDETGAGLVFTAHGLGWKLSGFRLPANMSQPGAMMRSFERQGL
ncbi:DUF2939 domain-containing protein [Sphingomonas bacterium]|uniref:DUF2939 domain-containing protein n=1 Tax=Sphingomonas bacterium TaxID=1895847 RepID=UPI002603C812|nr:DUF2939 domain-containing protein [Sphingomonas bacterium]MDB5678758.1 hypothetical protein [Sphingomonas bacterium]